MELLPLTLVQVHLDTQFFEVLVQSDAADQAIEFLAVREEFDFAFLVEDGLLALWAKLDVLFALDEELW